MILTMTSIPNDLNTFVITARLKLMRIASDKPNLRVLVCQANFFDSLVNRIRQRRKELPNQQPRVIQQHTANSFEHNYTLSPKGHAGRNTKAIRPMERFTSDDNKMAKGINGIRDELHALNFTPRFSEKQKLSIISADLLSHKNPIKSATISSMS